MKPPMDVLLDAIEWHPTGDAEDVSMVDDSIPWVTHEGTLIIGGFNFRCLMLNDGRRIIDSEDLEKFFGLLVEKK